jgi:hypothetical protein
VLPFCIFLMHMQVHDGEEFNTVAAGEDVGVQVTFKNPLQVKLGLSRVRLHVQFTPADKATPGAGAPAASPADAGGGMGGEAVSAEDVLVMESQFSLHPGGEKGLAGVCYAVLGCGMLGCGEGSDSMLAGSRRGRICALPSMLCVFCGRSPVKTCICADRLLRRR